MKFVHITSLKDTASTLPPAVTRQLLEATVAWVNQRKQAGKLLEIYAMAGWRRTMAIYEVESAEAVVQGVAGSGNRISVTELAGQIVGIAGAGSTLVYTQPRKGDAEHTWANVDKARRELGWEPRINLELGLERFIDWKRNYGMTEVNFL